MPDRVRGGHARQSGRAGAREIHRADHAVRRRARAVPLAGASDVARAVRRLRSSGARQGMVGLQRRGRSGGRMNAPRIIPHDVRRVQIDASNPAVSAWVAANAGSGKTYVLAQRVIRLMLDGAEPAKVLCLTFTKAAAANRANQICGTLAAWIALDDDALDHAIEEMEGEPPDELRRARARRLFAQALDTPGGLKVQTIHAFCTRLLHQFPFEADVAARFTVLDEAAEAKLLDQVSLGVLLEAARAPGGALGRALATAIASVADQTFKDVIEEA